jgi:predicted methyltransferase
MKRLAAAAGLAALIVAAPALAGPSPALTAALADAGRPAADTAKDADRKPAELLEFAGVKPGWQVMDVWPGGGYWSRLFSKTVGPKGKVYAYVPEEIAGFKGDPVKAAKAIGMEPGHENVVEVDDPLAQQPTKEFTNTLDLVWTFENYHDFHAKFMKGADVDGFNRSVFALLKPGGVYVVVDHAAAAGAPLTVVDELHRIDPSAVKAEVERAGFKFVGESKVLANPADPHTDLVFKDTIRGKTDRFAYKFVKPK